MFPASLSVRDGKSRITFLSVDFLFLYALHSTNILFMVNAMLFKFYFLCKQLDKILMQLGHSNLGAHPSPKLSVYHFVAICNFFLMLQTMHFK